MKRPTGNKPLRKFPGPLVLLGAGKMGAAMLDGWLARGLPAKQIAVVEPRPSKAVKALARSGVALNPKRAQPAAAIVIAVKPQSAPEALPALAPHIGKRTLAISIMAGRTLAFLQQALPGAAVVRAMPNTPAAIGRGITVAVANAQVSRTQRKLAGDLLTAIGAVEWVDDERLMDAVTAVSGSGPAYVFLLAEEMAKAGIAAGLPPALAARLARPATSARPTSSKGWSASSAISASTALSRSVVPRGGAAACALRSGFGLRAMTASCGLFQLL